MVAKYVAEDVFVTNGMSSEKFCTAVEKAEAVVRFCLGACQRAEHFDCIPPPWADLRAGGVWVTAAAS